MGVNIQFSQSYHWLNSWVLANVIQLATQDFCDRFVDYRIDPGRRLYDQMVMAARCGVANIAEGSARHSTSVETEMRLLDSPQYSNSYLHDAARHILAQKSKFSRWLENGNPEIVANALLVLCLRENKMLQAQIQSQLDSFRQTGGFTENMSAERLEFRKSRASAGGAPLCPKCGKPMLRRMQKKGQLQGREFWGCSDYPACNGVLPISGPNPPTNQV